MRIAVVGPFRFPSQAASTQRISGLIKTFELIGAEVLVGSAQSEDWTPTEPNTTHATVTALGEWPREKWSRPRQVLRPFVWGAKTKNWLESMVPAPDLVVVYQGFLPYLLRVLPWARSRNIPVVVDVVEWYERSHLPLGPMGPYALNSELSVRWANVRAGNCIVISSYLERYYDDRGCRTLRIPPTSDVSAVEPRLSTTTGRLELAYAGTAGRKDLLGNVVRAVAQTDPTGQRIRLSIAGPTEQEVMAMLSPGSELPACVSVKGPIDHASVVSMVRDADFVPIFRTAERYAEAGFPTKVPESLALGTPVMCNLFGDLSAHLEDGSQAIIAENASVDAISGALSRALSLSAEQRAGMRAESRTLAESAFDFHQYSAPTGRFIESVLSSRSGASGGSL